MRNDPFYPLMTKQQARNELIKASALCALNGLTVLSSTLAVVKGRAVLSPIPRIRRWRMPLPYRAFVAVGAAGSTVELVQRVQIVRTKYRVYQNAI